MSSNQDKKRIVELQSQIKIARAALTRIASGCRNPESVADEALYNTMPLDPKRPLQSLIGHLTGK